MEEQTKTEETQGAEQSACVSETKETKKASESLKMVAKMVLGGVLILLGLGAVIGWWSSLWIVFKGCIGLFLILAGAITIAIAKE
ncbi:MAG: hypothetical protein KKC11_02295 [Candidatus Omnitrophica bacterium]|nr:hypothetical protein [Candidatus Omnitrophota bacterium]MBU0879067.1 hypothetical protein [Candidatus Omnitrophota bacterium]MBU0897361.1 hypothetical protein [Candidatus Omnitrophota bacterium]MBU1133881.1 hypothetical protein [Candidatus Omnitrophota bacterium]MBU1810664.1 hypothetical protein [Candidatus Omnitrophota bacterium]